MIGYLAFIFVFIFQMFFGSFFDTNSFVESYAKEVQDEVVALPILMFHSFTTDESQVNNTTIITDKKFEEVINVMQNNGYRSISFKELEGYVKGYNKLPEKPYIITSDDGYLDNYEIMYPILKEKNERAIISIIGERIENESIGEIPKLNWDQINEMIGSNIIEIGNHTYAMHEIRGIDNADRDGAIINSDESQLKYAKAFSEDVKKMNELIYQKCGIVPKVFCYPFGYFDVLSEALISGCGFDITLTVDEGMNYIKHGERLNLLKRYNIDMNTDVEELIEGWR